MIADYLRNPEMTSYPCEPELLEDYEGDARKEYWLQCEGDEDVYILTNGQPVTDFKPVQRILSDIQKREATLRHCNLIGAIPPTLPWSKVSPLHKMLIKLREFVDHERKLAAQATPKTVKGKVSPPNPKHVTALNDWTDYVNGFCKQHDGRRASWQRN